MPKRKAGRNTAPTSTAKKRSTVQAKTALSLNDFDELEGLVSIVADDDGYCGRETDNKVVVVEWPEETQAVAANVGDSLVAHGGRKADRAAGVHPRTGKPLFTVNDLADWSDDEKKDLLIFLAQSRKALLDAGIVTMTHAEAKASRELPQERSGCFNYIEDRLLKKLNEREWEAGKPRSRGASAPASGADEFAKCVTLHEQGHITDDELASLKAKHLGL